MGYLFSGRCSGKCSWPPTRPVHERPRGCCRPDWTVHTEVSRTHKPVLRNDQRPHLGYRCQRPQTGHQDPKGHLCGAPGLREDTGNLRQNDPENRR